MNKATPRTLNFIPQNLGNNGAKEFFFSSFILLPSSLKKRKGWDSNPRNPFEVHYISNVANSTALAPFPRYFKFQISDSKLFFQSGIWNLESGIKMAERVGFEPTEPVKVQQFSRLPDSTTLAPLLLLKWKCKKVEKGKS